MARKGFGNHAPPSKHCAGQPLVSDWRNGAAGQAESVAENQEMHKK
jgi:hypothetical protein